ncbi:polymer-forming cytoskeletal protein [Chitinibacter bivalviorum]|uniref:Polymer-forming cytoskeletal protein n=1 Tax=Chitinibacter bivalviorum TaxID=2739434 RepID=A0A7H9BGA7_9NEIS|nr:polymer-forming cytoskeletal protein [Chitinibacter bivalviorum]QLG86971.1 polymer-forming cytoskeletal protein [Chitinibacter bivalviorum]
MFNKKKGSTKIDSLIGQGTTLTGDVSFAGGLRVDGVIIGNVSMADEKNGTLVVSEKARIEGKVICSHLILNGEIRGPIEVSHYVELQAKSRIVGDLSYKTLEMHPGAIIEGRLVHVHNGKREEVAADSVPRTEPKTA